MTTKLDAKWKPERIAIVGVGLLGGSVALAARRRWPGVSVVGSSRNSDTRCRIVDQNLVDEAFDDPSLCVVDCDFVVIAAPVVRIAAMLPSISASANPNATITDVGSTKVEIVNAAEADSNSAKLFVGSHPIAGSEKTGDQNAKADLFDGKISIVTPTDRSDPVRVEMVKAFWQGIGCRVQVLSPAEHDRALAAASHMPHIASAALAMTLPQEFSFLTGTGFRDTTRIAAGDPSMWRQIVEANRDATIAELDRFSTQLQEFRSAIEHRHWDTVEDLFLRAQVAKQATDQAADL